VLSHLSGMDTDVQDAVALMVSELATNAVLHAGTEFDVTLTLDGNQLRVEVSDRGPRMPQVQPPPPPTEEHGRGLRIVRELSESWGIEGRTGAPGKSVWFQLATSRLANA